MAQTNENRSEAEFNAIIAEQNDRFRTTWGADFTVPGQIVLTRGVADLSPAAKAIIMQRVQTFSEFTEDNDPYGDHTIGAFKFEIAGNSYHIFWKIDLYDKDYCMGSNDPADVAVTRRVLTVLHASEY
ncbi:uncharacterized protein DUF3768 [Planktotalea frisia]|jgi:hypothetical protein|uniref:DUF3768 domain-containing protein n=1 Tax=Planktotalea frisia TaxID=696762 RepID=A0A1L9NSI9_9RHOB|nr:DUF3768 domain-containing protein [Planktotalea frisia]OJI92265.1 hypothetical protein PFRI_35120 [Planktotalea frisia]PZX23136.1 uncharacterized protein DUF3768 [Planktotalea frisia]